MKKTNVSCVFGTIKRIDQPKLNNLHKQTTKNTNSVLSRISLQIKKKKFIKFHSSKNIRENF